jgi:hypothetical protein
VKNIFRYFIRIVSGLLVIIGCISLLQLTIKKINRIKASNRYSKNVTLIKQGIEISKARKLMEESLFDEELKQKIAYEITIDSTIVICLNI